ncbi:NAD(P)/FAD-dependent oxidoreductase [Fervidicoccus fontis]|uniref:Dehydrogenase, FixC domain protein n=1 Tax=Fervidicoccus fontis (strain DSM 19380 / JCM 18336 / VKM B-2539 / Kam940) TaxID=1163730 RepID=H9ZZT7_FERFK|nr:NAD(P)/FAD-dependent oxidoreductase [Fervidicoccus fontis]AFH42244.1 dehydrogenase, FixC domain protein [Fervidicoccus fontis Kam940]
MEFSRINIIGAGPAGASLAFFLSSLGYSNITVYESSKVLGSKPCGMAVPASIKDLIKLENEHIINEIKGYRLFIDEKLLHEDISGTHWGYIINKQKFLEDLVSDVEVKREHLKINLDELSKRKDELYVIAAGIYWNGSPKERLNAVEATVNVYNWNEPSIIQIWFDTKLMGYYWAFPHSEKKVNIGVGGFEDFFSLKARLIKFIKKIGSVEKMEPEKILGSQIVSTGIVDSILSPAENVFAIGEGVGSVLPLTGEGIRPSIQMAKIFSENISSKELFIQNFKSSALYKTSKIQRKILSILKQMPPFLRNKIMRSIPKDIMIKIGLGSYSENDVNKLKLILKTFQV